MTDEIERINEQFVNLLGLHKSLLRIMDESFPESVTKAATEKLLSFAKDPRFAKIKEYWKRLVYAELAKRGVNYQERNK